MDIAAINPLALPSLSLNERAALPDEPAIYFALAGDATVLYIGKARRLAERWKSTQHHRYAQLSEMGNIRLAWLSVSDEKLLDKIEIACIEHFKPTLNKSLRPRRARDEDDKGAILRVRDAASDKGLNLNQFAQALNAARARRNQEFVAMGTVRRYWYSTKDGSSTSEELDLISWSFLQEIAGLLGVSVYELLPVEDGLGNLLPTPYAMEEAA